MSIKEELSMALNILRKYNMPISPILEYAINEAIQHEKIVSTLPSVDSNIQVIQSYEELFANLSVGLLKGKKLPHKAVLLLAIIDLIETQVISQNIISLDSDVLSAFNRKWKSFFTMKIPSVWIPFWYMKGEKFWHFKALNNDSELNAVMNFAGHPSIGQMKQVIKYAYLDEELFSLLNNKKEREHLSNILIKTYIEQF